MHWLTLRVDIFEILRLSQALDECKISEKKQINALAFTYWILKSSAAILDMPTKSTAASCIVVNFMLRGESGRSVQQSQPLNFSLVKLFKKKAKSPISYPVATCV